MIFKIHNLYYNFIKKHHMDKEKEDEIDKLDTFERPNYSEFLSGTNKQIGVLENILKLYVENGGKRIYLGICAYLIDYYCTYLLAMFSQELAKDQKPNFIAQMQIRDELPSNMHPRSALQQIQMYFEEFDSIHPLTTQVTLEVIYEYVAQCPYLRFGYGIFRMIDRDMQHPRRYRIFSEIVEGEWRGRIDTGFCNCLSIALMTALVAEHRGLGFHTITCMEEIDCASMREKLGGSIALLYHHIDPRPADIVRNIWPHAQVGVTGQCKDIYNFILLPIEAMIVDHISGITSSMTYFERLKTFLTHVQNMISRIPPVASEASLLESQPSSESLASSDDTLVAELERILAEAPSLESQPSSEELGIVAEDTSTNLRLPPQGT